MASKQSNNNCKWKAKERQIDTNNNKPVQTHSTHSLQSVEEPRKVCYWHCHTHSWYSSHFRFHRHQCYLIESVINSLSKLIRWHQISFLNSIEIQCNIKSVVLQQLHNTFILIDWRISGRWTACNNIVSEFLALRSIPNTLIAVKCDKKNSVSVIWNVICGHNDSTLELTSAQRTFRNDVFTQNNSLFENYYLKIWMFGVDRN